MEQNFLKELSLTCDICGTLIERGVLLPEDGIFLCCDCLERRREGEMSISYFLGKNSVIKVSREFDHKDNLPEGHHWSFEDVCDDWFSKKREECAGAYNKRRFLLIKNGRTIKSDLFSLEEANNFAKDYCHGNPHTLDDEIMVVFVEKSDTYFDKEDLDEDTFNWSKWRQADILPGAFHSDKREWGSTFRYERQECV